MKTTYMLIDISNIMFAAQSTTKLHIGATEVQAIYGTLRTIRALLDRYPAARPILLHDGASWRKRVFPEYKEQRTKDATAEDQRKLAERAALKTQKPHIESAFKWLGIPQVKAHNYEADDLAGILVERAERKGDGVLLISGDQDWVQLVGPSVTWFDPIRNVKVMPKDLMERFGVDTAEKFLEVKALQGDVGDNIPGVGGIGKLTAPKLIMEFESVKNLHNLMVEGSLPKQPKKIEDFVRSGTGLENFKRNMSLMNLRSGPHRPPAVQMTITHQEPNLAAFRVFCERLLFKSMLNAFDTWVHPFVRGSASHGAIAA